MESDIYLQIPGIPGESRNDAHKEQIEVSNFELERDALIAAAGGSGSGKTTFQPLVVDIQDGTALVRLLDAAAMGTAIPTLSLSLHKAGDIQQQGDFETITLTGVRVVGIETEQGLSSKVALSYI